MATVFDRILRHEEPAQLVWEDDLVVAFLDTHPHTDGHTLVIPRREEDQWTELVDEESHRLFWVAKQIGKVQVAEFGYVRAGLVVAGYHVPHVHVHVFPTNDMSDFDFSGLPVEATPIELERNGARLRAGLRRFGFDQQVPAVK